MKKNEGMIAQVLAWDQTKKIEILKVEDGKIEITADGKYIGRYLHYTPKVKGYDYYKDYHRHLIQLSPQNIIVIHHFSNKHETFDQILEEQDMIEENGSFFNEALYKTSAEQFFDQLEGHYCDAFLEELIVVATKKLAESDNRLQKFEEKLEGQCCVVGSRAEKALEKAKEAIK